MLSLILKKNFILPILVLGALICFSGCKTSRQLSYFKDLPNNVPVNKIGTAAYEPLKLQPNDEVQVTISSTSPEASQFFNLMAITPSVSIEGAASNSQSQGYINLYRVSSDGNITLPVLGDIKALGLSTEELKTTIHEKLKEYLKDAIVTVKLTNFKVTVIGEVGNPKEVPVNGQTINVLEAVGAAGDLTVFGIRNNVKVIRKLPDGTTEVALLNFNKSDVLRSPYFQLKQNDIVYIQPNKNKGVLGTKTSIFVPIITSLVYVAALVITRK